MDFKDFKGWRRFEKKPLKEWRRFERIEKVRKN